MKIGPDKEVPQAIAAVLDTLRGEVLRDVQTPQARTSLLNAIRLLGRVLDELAVGDTLARECAADWQALHAEIEAALGAPRAAGADEAAADAHQQLKNRSSEIQALLRASAGSERAKRVAAEWVERLTRAHERLFDCREEALLDFTAPIPPRADTETQPLHQALSRYLNERFPRLDAGTLRRVRILPGGYSKQTALLELTANDDLPSHLVIRRDIVRGSSTGTSAANEFPLLQQMHAAGLPVPRPLLAEADPERIGGGFILMEEIVGATRAGELFPELNGGASYHPDFPFEVARVLAALHRMSALPASFRTSGHFAHGDDPVATVRGFQEMWRNLTSPPFTALMDAGYAWLLANPVAPGRLRRVVHADVGAHNILTRDGHLAALLDWELTHLGDPAQDLAMVRTLLIEPLVPWQRFVDEYLAAGGPIEACDPHAVHWFSVWNHVRNCTYTSILYNRVREGVLGDINNIAAGWDYTARVQRYLAKDLARALRSGRTE